MTESILPDKPSALIRVALADLRAVEAHADYEVDMDVWHVDLPYPHDGGPQCCVCLAGAVMAQSLKANMLKDFTPDDFPNDCEKLYALEFFRQGYVDEGLNEMGLETPVSIPDLEIPEYAINRGEFHEAMNRMAEKMEDNGL